MTIFDKMQGGYNIKIKEYSILRIRRRNHLFQILSKSVKGCPSCKGPKMGVFHWLWQSPWQQVSTTMLPVIKYKRFSIKTQEFINRRKQKHTCFTAAEKCWIGTAALVDGGVGGTDEQTPNVVISTPAYAGQANTFNYRSNTNAHEHYWWCSTTSRKYPQPPHLTYLNLNCSQQSSYKLRWKTRSNDM